MSEGSRPWAGSGCDLRAHTLTAAWSPGLQGVVGISVACSHLTLNVGGEIGSPSSSCWGPGVWDVNPCRCLSPQPGGPPCAEERRLLWCRYARPGPWTRSFSLHPRRELQIALRAGPDGMGPRRSHSRCPGAGLLLSVLCGHGLQSPALSPAEGAFVSGQVTALLPALWSAPRGPAQAGQPPHPALDAPHVFT